MIGFLSNPAAAIGSCSRCRLFSERMYRYNFDTDECTDRCFLFARRGVNQGFKCGTCEDAGANDIDTTKFNTQLDLSNVGATEQQAFIDASKRWDEVITGDLLTVSGASVRDFSLCGESIPTLNDDIFVCANSSTLDGPGGVLAFASPEYVRSEEVSRDVGFPTVGVIKIDADDIEPLKSAGLFEKLVVSH